MPVQIIGGNMKDIPKDAINTTSRSIGFGKTLSPFFLEGGHLYSSFFSKNIENAWQYSKIYQDFVDKEGNPTKAYFIWAKSGWRKERADRYPMGRGAKPLYSYWDGQKLDYIDARKKIYIPLYARAVVKTKEYNELKRRYDKGEDLILWDFDGYKFPDKEKTYLDVINDEKKKMGHAFVLGMLLEDIISVDEKGLLKTELF